MLVPFLTGGFKNWLDKLSPVLEAPRHAEPSAVLRMRGFFYQSSVLHAEICNLGAKGALSCFGRASRGKEEGCRSKAIGVFFSGVALAACFMHHIQVQCSLFQCSHP